ncbi:eCIS core domain-containing protein [Streptomyces sp. H39-S7]|uniref:eCIS core domain-containing protein n=1 Tax=Streptomyces sp. H39-S7 TaxID=3004357 RepID=UPI0022AE721D|nr:DUF4157 domain-containing protein [Streptomyces sp. H39-S7]MCZ4122300.1 DUF4157 domain-containing protein [Streptomyces sp. H39-S7]
MQRRARAAEHGDEAEEQRQAQNVREVLNSPGRPLDGPTLGEMQARHGGADFSSVRMHDDAKAQRSAAEIGARAYTSGENIVRGKGGFDKKTLAHELKHVLQQREGPVAGTPTGGGLTMSDKSDHHEREAEASSNEVMAGPVPVQSAPGTDSAAYAPLDAVQRSASQPGSAESGPLDVVQRAKTKEESSKKSGKRKADRDKGESPPRERRKTRASERPEADLDKPTLTFSSSYVGDEIQNLNFDTNIGFQQTATLHNPANATSSVAANYIFWQEVTDSFEQVVESEGLNRGRRRSRRWEVDGPFHPDYDDWSITNGQQAISFHDSPGFTGNVRMSDGYFLKSYQVQFRWKVAKNTGGTHRNTAAGWTSPVMTHTATSQFDPANATDSSHVIHQAAGDATWQVDLSGT